jgi:hypothetical protein
MGLLRVDPPTRQRRRLLYALAGALRRNCRQRRRDRPATRAATVVPPPGAAAGDIATSGAAHRGQRPARGEGQPLPPDFTPSEDMLELLERFHGVPRAFALQQRRTSSCTGANAAAPATPGKTVSNSMYNSTGPDHQQEGATGRACRTAGNWRSASHAG